MSVRRTILCTVSAIIVVIVVWPSSQMSSKDHLSMTLLLV